MGDCDNTVKPTATRWWTRASTKGGSLPPNGQHSGTRSRGHRLFHWVRGRSRSENTEQIPGQSGVSPDQSPPFQDDSMSRLLKDVLVQRLEAERGAQAAACTQNWMVQQTDLSRLESGDQADLSQRLIPRWKRILDLTLIVVTYPIWLPLMLVIMAAIKISSPGPIFYRQERVGLRGRSFMIFKFRSMKLHAQTSGHESYVQRLMLNGAPMTKLDAGDPRIIPWGRFLRATGLDELPQIFNVLRGEMSLVGPRPSTRLEFERYEEWQQERVITLPGLTGYWQVNGKNKTTFQQMIEMDLYYAKNLSLGLDLWIMMKTPVALVGQTFELLQQRTVALTKLSAETQTIPARSPDGGGA